MTFYHNKFQQVLVINIKIVIIDLKNVIKINKLFSPQLSDLYRTEDKSFFVK